jgi:hypothetical protein
LTPAGGWRGWWAGWLHIQGSWQRCCLCATEDEARHALRERAKRLGLFGTPAEITTGSMPTWTPGED